MDLHMTASHFCIVKSDKARGLVLAAGGHPAWSERPSRSLLCSYPLKLLFQAETCSYNGSAILATDSPSVRYDDYYLHLSAQSC